LSINLSDEQIKQFTTIFNEFDSDGSGKISVSELASLFRMLGKPKTKAHLLDLVAEIDDDNNGVRVHLCNQTFSAKK
jgi:Ca2+-binding EF-hand superfamily protein